MFIQVSESGMNSSDASSRPSLAPIPDQDRSNCGDWSLESRLELLSLINSDQPDVVREWEGWKDRYTNKVLFACWFYFGSKSFFPIEVTQSIINHRACSRTSMTIYYYSSILEF